MFSEPFLPGDSADFRSSSVTVTFQTPEARNLLQHFKGDMHRRDLQVAMDLKDAEHFRRAYLIPALASGLIEMTLPDKPKSSKQRYRLTTLGKATLKPTK